MITTRVTVLLAGMIIVVLAPACYGPGGMATPTHFGTSQPIGPGVKTAVSSMLLPTPIPAGSPIKYQGLQVTMDQYEFSQAYTTQFDTPRLPSADKKFLWIHVVLKNINNTPVSVPRSDRYSVLNYTVEIKNSYGYRKDFPDYGDLDPSILPDQTAAGWLRFEVPAGGGPENLIFIFSPETSHVADEVTGTPVSWAEHNLFAWALAP